MERLYILAKAHADVGWTEQAISPRDAVDERVHSRAGRFVNGSPGIFQPHRGLEDKEVVVTCIVEVERPSSSHG